MGYLRSLFVVLCIVGCDASPLPMPPDMAIGPDLASPSDLIGAPGSPCVYAHGNTCPAMDCQPVSPTAYDGLDAGSEACCVPVPDAGSDGICCQYFNTDTFNCKRCNMGAWDCTSVLCGGISTCSTLHVSENLCRNGECAGTCVKGFADCDGDKRYNGCEHDVSFDAKNCGTCGAACGSRMNCDYGVCVRCGSVGQPCCEGLVCNDGESLCQNDGHNGRCV